MTLVKVQQVQETNVTQGDQTSINAAHKYSALKNLGAVAVIATVVFLIILTVFIAACTKGYTDIPNPSYFKTVSAVIYGGFAAPIIPGSILYFFSAYKKHQEDQKQSLTELK
ncbi:MAG: hypothetical protein JJU12_02875 [Chlamydiales bacterium]|nr:hypothetical protein [Chlamydiales bacterium]